MFSYLCPWSSKSVIPPGYRPPPDTDLLAFSGGFLINTSHNSLMAHQINAAAIEVCKLAQPLQLNLTHDQERSVEPAFGSMILTMLESLRAMIQQVQLLNPKTKLRFKLVSVIAFRSADIGKFDGPFSIEVFNEDRQTVASGHFSKTLAAFEWAAFNPKIEEQVIERIAQAVELFADEFEISADALHNALLSAKISLPITVVVKLAEALSPAGDDRADPMFGRVGPIGVLEHYLRDPHHRVELDGEWVRVTKHK